MQLLTLLAWALLPGCWAVTGPRSVWGFLGGSLSLNCTYEAGYERKPKFWCRPGTISTCAADIVITSERQPEVRRGRFCIRDDRQHRVITVTVESLRMEDEGTFRCGVRNSLLRPDTSADVEVMVLEPPGPSKPSLPQTTTRKALTPSSSASAPIQTTSEGKTVQPSSDFSNQESSSPPHWNMVEYILTSAIVVVLLMLAVAAAFLVKLFKKRKKALSGAAVEMDRIRSMSRTGEDTLNYADINVGAAESHLYSNAETFHCLANNATEYTEVKQSNKHSEDMTYTTVQQHVMENQIYANVRSAPPPREELYSGVQRV